MDQVELGISMEDFLEHFGVKGMKWGVRRHGPQSDDHKNFQKARKKHVSELSDNELRTMLNRMNMEQQTKRMSPGTVKKGLGLVAAALATGELINKAINFRTTPAGRAIRERLSNKATRLGNIDFGPNGLVPFIK